MDRVVEVIAENQANGGKKTLVAVLNSRNKQKIEQKSYYSQINCLRSRQFLHILRLQDYRYKLVLGFLLLHLK